MGWVSYGLGLLSRRRRRAAARTVSCGHPWQMTWTLPDFNPTSESAAARASPASRRCLSRVVTLRGCGGGERRARRREEEENELPLASTGGGGGGRHRAHRSACSSGASSGGGSDRRSSRSWVFSRSITASRSAFQNLAPALIGFAPFCLNASISSAWYAPSPPAESAQPAAESGTPCFSNVATPCLSSSHSTTAATVASAGTTHTRFDIRWYGGGGGVGAFGSASASAAGGRRRSAAPPRRPRWGRLSSRRRRAAAEAPRKFPERGEERRRRRGDGELWWASCGRARREPRCKILLLDHAPVCVWRPPRRRRRRPRCGQQRPPRRSDGGSWLQGASTG